MGIDWERRTETCDFWIGVFPDEHCFTDYVGESPDYYDFLEDNPETVRLTPRGAPPDPDQRPLSKFIGDQGQGWYDHDTIEMGFNANAKTIGELVHGYSYSDQYVDELTWLAKQTGLTGVNAFLFISSGEIRNPQSVKTDKFDFRYVGQITYKI